MRKRIIITGAMGQDGKILSNILLKNNYSVIGIIKKKQLYKRIKKVKYFNVNLLHYDPIYKIIKKIKPYAIVHLASNNKSHSPKNLNKINYNIHYKSNFNMTYNLINAAVNNDRKIKFIFAGSSHMFGDTKKKRVDEKTPFVSNSFYSKYKIDSHKYIMNVKRKFNLKITTAILFNHDSKHRNKKFLLPRIVSAIKNKKLSFLNTIYKANIARDFSHANEICYAIYLLIKSRRNLNEVILSSKKLVKVNDLIDFLLKVFKSDMKLKKNILPTKKYTFYGDNTVAIKKLKWKIKQTIFDAVLDMKNCKI